MKLKDIERKLDEKRPKSPGVALAYVASVMLPAAYLMSSLTFGTPNPLRWSEIMEERQEYSQLRDQAIACVDKKDEAYGFLGLDEIDDLYIRAEINPDPITGKRPVMERDDLTRIVKSCEPKE